MSESQPYAFVTVGTTSFASLIDLVFSETFAQRLRECWAISHIVVQWGRAEKPALLDDRNSYVLAGVTYKGFSLLPDISGYMAGASLIVTHAGAGSIFEACRVTPRVPVIAVINTELAENHQEELATAMSVRGYLLSCTVDTLIEMVGAVDALKAAIAPLAPFSVAQFQQALDSLL